MIPGIVKCVPKTSRKVDTANAPGLDAATIRLQGLDPGAFSLEILTWTAEQQAALEALLSRVAPVAGKTTYTGGRYTTTTPAAAGSQKRPASFQFHHPAAAAAGIASIVIEAVTWFAPGPVPQSRVCTLECKQAMPPKKIIAGTPQLNAANLGGVPGAPSTSAAKRGP